MNSEEFALNVPERMTKGIIGTKCVGWVLTQHGYFEMVHRQVEEVRRWPTDTGLADAHGPPTARPLIQFAEDAFVNVEKQRRRKRSICAHFPEQQFVRMGEAFLFQQLELAKVRDSLLVYRPYGIDLQPLSEGQHYVDRGKQPRPGFDTIDTSQKA